jgi:N-acetylmuramoyl-L-alanine amidase
MRPIILCCLLSLFIFNKANGQSLSGLKIYINPGHGGYDSDDRNVVVAPFAAGDTAGFWESKSNLVKGLYLRKLLESAGAQVIMSRVENRTVDDRSLSAIAEEANANRSDFMISVHSNAYNAMSNYVLMLFHGWDNSPILPQSMALANLFWDNLFSNQVTYWTYRQRNVRGDKSFAPVSWDGYGVLRPLTVPGLISEGSFHDYPPETYRLLNNDYKRMEAWQHFRAFCQYYGGNPGRKGKIAGFVKDSIFKVTNYGYIANSTDQWLPVNGASVSLEPGNQIYKVDHLNNGFFIFDNLDPGTYRVMIEADHYRSLTSPELRVDSAKITYYAGYMTPHSVVNRETESGNPSGAGITIFPNPARSNISFTTEKMERNSRFQISDLSGRTVLEGKLSEWPNPSQIDIRLLLPGSYVLILINEGQRFHGLFLKQ